MGYILDDKDGWLKDRGPKKSKNSKKFKRKIKMVKHSRRLNRR